MATGRKIKPYGKTVKSETYQKSSKVEGDNELTIGSKYRSYGSTHRSATKERIVRGGKKAARRKAKKECQDVETKTERPQYGLAFQVKGQVGQKFEILKKGLTPKALMAGLKDGTYLTFVGAEFITDENGEKVAVVNDNWLEITNFKFTYGGEC
jgi:hypothetical protein